jgi:DNA-binding GntR family transcriptional regulator
MSVSPATTRSDATLQRLRADILNGRLEPGSKLGFADLGSRYDVSTGVLREVLPRLVEQGLVTSEAQLGFRVVTVSVDNLGQLTEARVAIETLVTRAAVIEGDLAWESEVVATHHALLRTPGYEPSGEFSPAWLDAHERFHLAVLSGCPNSYLVNTAARLRAIAEVYRCWTRDAAVRAHRDVAGEHREIMESAIARDVEGCAKVTEHHIRTTTDLMLAGRS